MWKILVDEKDLQSMEGIIEDDAINDTRVFFSSLKEDLFRANLPTVTIIYRNLETNELFYVTKVLTVRTEEEIKDYKTKDGFYSFVGVFLHNGELIIRCDEFPIFVEDPASVSK